MATVELENLTEKIKEELFETSIIDCDYLDDIEEIYHSNRPGLENDEYFCIVKRAAAEYKLAKEYRRQKSSLDSNHQGVSKSSRTKPRKASSNATRAKAKIKVSTSLY